MGLILKGSGLKTNFQRNIAFETHLVLIAGLMLLITTDGDS